MEFTSLENAEIVIATGNFSPATIATLWILNEVDIKKVARIEKLPENLDKKIIKLGFEREETLEIRDNNIAYGTAGLLWRKYGTQICVKNNTRKEHIICSEIDKRIIGTIDFYQNLSFHDWRYTIWDILLSYNLTKELIENWRGDVELLKISAIEDAIARFDDEILRMKISVEGRIF